MKKRYVVSAIGGAIGAGAAGYLLAGKGKKCSAKNMSVSEDTTFKDGGIPDQTDKNDLAQFENAKMVSEGSQFGVNYYNEVKARMDEKEQKYYN
jgi:hypothetical protein